MTQLEAMGFPPVRCQKALLATGNADAEAAMEWLFAHMDDPDIDAPIALQAQAGGNGGEGGGPEPAAEQVAMLADMGFSEGQARKALKETVSPHLVYLLSVCRGIKISRLLDGRGGGVRFRLATSMHAPGCLVAGGSMP